MSPLEVELEAALRSTDPLVATVALCRAWALVPSTRVAKLARGFERQVHRASVPGANELERETQWHALAEHAQPEDLGTLLATPWSKKPKLAARRLEVFARLGPDPRVVGHLLELDTGNRFPSTSGRRFWLDAYELLLSWGAVEASERIPKTPLVSPSLTESLREGALYRPLQDRHARRGGGGSPWNGSWPEEPTLSEPERQLVEQLERRLAPAQKATSELLAAVQSTPDDDAPRLVLADALTEQGDPRGEFIALQFAHARGELTMGKREHLQRLLSASGRAWFDGLEDEIEPLTIFERGFLSEVSLRTRAPNPALPAWRTVQVLAAGSVATALSSFLAHPNLARVHSLRSVRGGTFEELARAGNERAFRLIEVHQLGTRELPAPKWTLETLRLLPSPDESVWWFSTSTLKDRVTTLSLAVRAAFERVGPLLLELEAARTGLQRVEFSAAPPWWPQLWHGDWWIRFERDANARFTAVTISLGDELLGGLEPALASLEREQVKSLRVQVLLKRGPTWRESTKAMIERALGGQKKLKRVELELERPVVLPPKPILYTGT